MAISMTKPPASIHTTLIDEALPVYEFNDVNTIVVRATLRAIMRAYSDVTLGEMTLLRPLFTLRALPARLTGHESPDDMPVDEPFTRWSLAPGSPWALLGEDPHEIVIGAIGNFAQANIDFVPVANAGQFLEFDDPNYSKTVLGIRVVPGGNPFSGYTVVAESRTHVPDDVQRRRFGRYWRVVRPFEAMMVRGALAAMKRRAEGNDELPERHHTLRYVALSVGLSLTATAVARKLRQRAEQPHSHDGRRGTRVSMTGRRSPYLRDMRRFRHRRETPAVLILVNTFQRGLPRSR